MNFPLRAAALDFTLAMLLFAGPWGMGAQSADPSPATASGMASASTTAAPSSGVAPAAVRLPGTSAVEQLLAFRDTEVKFDLRNLMEVLRDRRHEGWVLASYPDPKTRRPLIGAGFSLDLPPRDHPQRDPLNPHLFLEPSSAELWQAAGLKSER